MQRFNPGIRLPQLLTHCFADAIWRLPGSELEIVLTFDDGPIPEVTPWVLDFLKKEQIKACFFCVGENVKRYPDVYRRILDEGHQTGNHTFNHLQGLKTPNKVFLSNIEKAAGYIHSNLFRPPHGWLRQSQYQEIKKDYQFVMWDIISGDYKKGLNPEMVIQNVLEYVRPGSVITFHDSIKAQNNLMQALPVIIKKLKQQGYQFVQLPQASTSIKVAI